MKRAHHFRRVLVVSLLGLCACVAIVGCSRSAKEDEVIGVAGSDAEMNAAIKTAREKLPHFWQVVDNPTKGEKSFSLKVKIADSKGVEHFWVSDIRRDNGKIYGTINNDPDVVKSVKIGQEIEVPEADISDWLYLICPLPRGYLQTSSRTIGVARDT